MTDFPTVCATFCFALLIWLLFSTLINLAVFHRIQPADASDLPAVGPDRLLSVLIPARNEAARIGPCLRSLCEQQDSGDNFEIVVLDDNSTDATTEVVTSFGFTNGATARRLLKGEPLPEGWTGKAWACKQLSEAAKGDYLLFTDADTVHAPGGIKAALSFAMKQRADLLSLWPRQITGSWSEQAVVPLVYMLILCFLPQALLRWLQAKPRIARLLPASFLCSLGAANGQFLLFRTGAYHAIGTHASVRSHLVEDIALARQVAARTPELRLFNADGYDVVSCRMYTTFTDLWEGFSKNLRPAFDHALGAFILFGVLQFVAFLLPFVLLITIGPSPLVLLCVGLVFLIRGLLTWRFHTPVWSWLTHPLGHGLALIIALNSWRLYSARRLRWKGRTYAGTPPGRRPSV